MTGPGGGARGPGPGGAGARADDPVGPLEDTASVGALLGRPAAGTFTVAHRRADGTPSVIANEPFLDDGTPMPTRYWLVDPELRDAVSRLEAVGGVRRAAAEVDPGALADAHARYAAQRDALVPPGHRGPTPSGGVGGTRKGVKCLHAHLAWWLVGGDDPVGAWVVAQLGVERTGPPGRSTCHRPGRSDQPGGRAGRTR